MLISNVYFCNNIYNIKHLYQYTNLDENLHEVHRLTARHDYHVHVKITQVHVKITLVHEVHEVHATDRHVNTRVHEVHEVRKWGARQANHTTRYLTTD